LAHAATPGLYDILVPNFFRWGAFSSESAERGPGNIFEPLLEWNQPTGGWRDGRQALIRRTALAAGAALAPALVYWVIRRRTRNGP